MMLTLQKRTDQEVLSDLHDLYCEEFVESYFQDYVGEIVASLIWTEDIYETALDHCAKHPLIDVWLDAEFASFERDESVPDHIWDEIFRFFRERWPHLETRQSFSESD